MISIALKNGWTGNQYSVFRVLLGLYLVVHFVHLLPWANEVFSSSGMLSNGMLSPFMHIFPNVFLINDSPLFVYSIVLSSAFAALCFMMGVKDKWAALWMVYILACLFGRNPLIANPALPYLGFMLLAHLFIPSQTKTLPKDVFLATWVILALSYTYSGYTKLFSPSWVSGDNIYYVLNNPLARDYFLRDFALWLPPIFLQALTWTVLYIELLFAPFVLFSLFRPIFWGIMVFIQLGFALLLNFFDLTAIMLLLHLLTFDPAWIKGKNIGQYPVLFYDGQCGLCHRVIKFLLAEDNQGHIRYAPLQGEYFLKQLPVEKHEKLPDSIVLLLDDGSYHTQSSAVALLLMHLGGLWRPMGTLLHLIPASMRDMGYQGVGRIRKKLFPMPDSLCPMVTQELKKKFL